MKLSILDPLQEKLAQLELAHFLPFTAIGWLPALSDNDEFFVHFMWKVEVSTMFLKDFWGLGGSKERQRRYREFQEGLGSGVAPKVYSTRPIFTSIFEEFVRNEVVTSTD